MWPDLGKFSLPREIAGGITTVESIAIRPEKTRLFRETPGDDLLSIEGKVVNVAYHGSETHIYVETANGKEISCTMQNSSRNLETAGIGDSCWVGWRPGDTLLLEQ